VQQEEHHVVLGEKLRDRWQFVRADLLPGPIHLNFPVGLPILVDPSQAVIGQEHLTRQSLEEILQVGVRLGWQRHLQYRIIGAEDLWQHALGERAGQLQPVFPAFTRQLPAILQRDIHAGLRLDQQIGFRQKTGEQHAMPMFIGALCRQPINRLHATSLIATISKLTAMRSQRITQLALLRCHARPWLVVMYCKLFNHFARTGLGNAPRRPDGIFKTMAQFAGERLHGCQRFKRPRLILSANW
jgi:hypothetical protein